MQKRAGGGVISIVFLLFMVDARAKIRYTSFWSYFYFSFTLFTF